MDIRQIIKEEIRRAFNENYPAGAQHDPNAPWNQDDSNIRRGDVARDIKYKLMWTDEVEFAFFKDEAGNTYVTYIDSIDRDDLEPYADREETFDGYDEDGFPMVSHGDWEITQDVIDNYINDEARVGKGLDAYESGEYNLVMLDDELRQDLLSVSKYMDEKHKQDFIDIVSGNINESGVTDLVNQQTMDTPTGTLFMMSMGESKK